MYQSSDADRHIEPSSSPTRLKLRENLKLKSRRLKKSAVLGLFSVLSVVIAFVVIESFSPKAERKAKDDSPFGISEPDYKIKSLPSSYAQLKYPTAVPTAESATSAVLAPEVKSASEEDKILREMELRKLKKRFEARESDIVFASLKSEVNAQGEVGQSRDPTSFDEYQKAGGEGPTNPRDNDNRQDDKESFLKSNRSDPTHVSGSLLPLRTDYEVLAGTQIPGLLLTGINSDLPGNLLGQVSQTVYDTATGKFTLIPQGTKVVGIYDSKIVYGQERALVVWTRLIFPNGSSLNLEGMPGVDISGYAGLSDKVNNHYLKLFTGVILTSVLGATAQVAQGPQETFNPSYSQLVTQGAAQNLNDAGQQITRKNLNIQPTLEIRPGMRFNIFVTKDLTLRPYAG